MRGRRGSFSLHMSASIANWVSLGHAVSQPATHSSFSKTLGFCESDSCTRLTPNRFFMQQSTSVSISSFLSNPLSSPSLRASFFKATADQFQYEGSTSGGLTALLWTPVPGVVLVLILLSGVNAAHVGAMQCQCSPNDRRSCHGDGHENHVSTAALGCLSGHRFVWTLSRN